MSDLRRLRIGLLVCGHVHRDAWEWNFGPGLDGETDRDCDNCGKPMHCERIVTTEYTTKGDVR